MKDFLVYSSSFQNRFEFFFVFLSKYNQVIFFLRFLSQTANAVGLHMDKLENVDWTDGIHFTLDGSKTGIINFDIEVADS